MPRPRLVVGFLLILAHIGLSATSFAQTRASTTQQARADRAWPAFFKNFKDAVGKRDQRALRTMLVPGFYFSGGGGDDNGDGDTRDEAFQYWNEPFVRGWRALERTLAKGTAPTARWWNDATENRPGRVAPPAANVRRNTAGPRPLVQWLAFFEFREDGRWYCTSFSECCD